MILMFLLIVGALSCIVGYLMCAVIKTGELDHADLLLLILTGVGGLALITPFDYWLVLANRMPASRVLVLIVVVLGARHGYYRRRKEELGE